VLATTHPRCLIPGFDGAILSSGWRDALWAKFSIASATTLDPIRRAIQNSQASLTALAERHGINPKTAANWSKRDTTADRPTGPRAPHSTVLSAQEEVIDFLRALIKAVPYKVHTVLTDHGIHFTTPSNTASAVPLIKKAMKRGELFRAHAFEYACAQNDVDHRLTKPRHPWTNGQVERMNRTIKDATVKRYDYDSHDQLRQHLADFVSAYNFARRLKTLKGLTPYEFICKTWLKEPKRFTLDPVHRIPGLNI